MIRPLGLVAAFVVVLSGCGDDPPTEKERRAIDSLVEACVQPSGLIADSSDCDDSSDDSNGRTTNRSLNLVPCTVYVCYQLAPRTQVHQR